VNRAAPKDRLQSLAARVDALSLRERALLLAALLVVFYVLWANLLMAPLEIQQKAQQGQVAQLHAHIALLDRQAQAVIARSHEDPDRTNRERRVALRGQIGGLNRRLRRYTSNLISPTVMVQVLKRMLHREPGLRLVAARSLPATPLLERPAGEGAKTKKIPATQAGIYKHGLTLEFDGTFPATLRYLKALEALPWQLFWDRMDYQVQHYPHARVTITVHTLSLDAGWVGV
jgi:MSHA biogenesis protein MshJ